MDYSLISKIYFDYKKIPLNRNIDTTNDEMYNTGPDWYFSVGESGLTCILNGLVLSRITKVSTILDLPCGHGRVGRHLRAAFPETEISFCDINKSGVEFCAKQFLGEAIYSNQNLLNVSFQKKFDVIWVGSLFTHLDMFRTLTWIEHLVKFLSEDGILVATFHGNWSIEYQKKYPMICVDKWNQIESEYNEVGYGYASYDDNDSPFYGISLSNPARIVSIATKILGVRLLAYTERGWADNHDVMVLSKTDRLESW